MDKTNNSTEGPRNYRARQFLRRRLVALKRQILVAVLFLIGVSYAPYRWCSRDADLWLAKDLREQTLLANGVEYWITSDLNRSTFNTGSSQFDGEWLFGTYLMAGFGFGQMALLHPDLRDHYLPLMGTCIDAIQSEKLRAYDRESWSGDPLTTLDGPEDHAAYLGYFNLLLGFHRQLKPDSPYCELNDQISEALARRMTKSATGLLETYPGETYPMDNCTVLASLILHARLTNAAYASLIPAWQSSFRKYCIDPKTGLLFQAVDKYTGVPLDEPRGSGTTLGLYFLSFADPELARELYTAVRSNLFRRVFGFGGVREYPKHIRHEVRDIDSGPIIFGFGLSPTGFLIGGSHMFSDESAFRALYATAHAWGAPLRRGDRLHFVTGASLGDSILFAMLTARPPDLAHAKIATAPEVP